MTKHTPGPWNIAKGISYLDESVSWMIPGVAHCGDGECSEANARLIAAAPELLAALENLLTYDVVERPAFRSKPHGAPNSTVRISTDKLVALEDAARAAIAKATEE